MRSVSSLLFCLGLSGALLAACAATEPTAAVATAQRYSCPMHPDVIRDHEGDCPICGMRLVPLKDEAQPAPSANANDVPAPAGEVAGRAVVTLDAARQQLIGLRTTHATMGKVGGIWRTVGRVEAEPTQIRSVTVKIAGYVEKLFTDSVGAPVRKGQPLFSLYSADLLAAQEEYLLARRSRDALRDAGGNVANGDTLVDAAARKLSLWDLPPAGLKRLEEGGKADGVMTVVAPDSGLVTALQVTQGAALQAGQMAVEITNLDEVWVMADAYQADLPRIRIGMGATYTVEALPGRTFDGEVAVIEPSLDPVTRTARVHLHVKNPGTEIRPGMFGEVLFQGSPHDSLLIPADAVIPSGTRDMVFVALGDGRFEPREVVLGERSRDAAPMVEVQRGLVEGDEIVTRANFLIDAESSLRASLAAVRGD